METAWYGYLSFILLYPDIPLGKPHKKRWEDTKGGNQKSTSIQQHSTNSQN